MDGKQQEENPMDDFFADIESEMERKMNCWNKRFHDCWKGKYTQAELASELNKAYQTNSFTQKAINRWMHIGDPKRGIKGFPEYETMVKIAAFFHVDVGYLTGETDYYLFTEEKASAYLHLNPTALRAIRGYTIGKSYFKHQNKELLDRVLTAKQFGRFLRALAELDMTFNDAKDGKSIWNGVIEKYGWPTVSEALENLDIDEHSDDPKPPDELMEVIHAVNDVIDQGYQIEQITELREDVLRYRLLSIHNKLIDELYLPQDDEE